MKNITINTPAFLFTKDSKKNLPLSERLVKVQKEYCCSKCEQQSVHLSYESFYNPTDTSCRIHNTLRNID